jgi:SRSO17 transposase
VTPIRFARLCPDNVRQTHQSLHHVVAQAPWSDDDILEAVRQYALPAMQKHEPIEAWIVDDTGFVKKGTHSVGVTRQYCGQVGKQEICVGLQPPPRPTPFFSTLIVMTEKNLCWS